MGEDRMAKLKAENAAREEIKKAGPHILEMTQNPMTSGLYPTGCPMDGTITAGPKDDDSKNYECALRGTGVKDDHAWFVNKGNKVTLTPNQEQGAQAMVN